VETYSGTIKLVPLRLEAKLLKLFKQITLLKCFGRELPRLDLVFMTSMLSPGIAIRVKYLMLQKLRLTLDHHASMEVSINAITH